MNVTPRRWASPRAQELADAMQARIAENVRRWRAMYEVEAFRPSFPPKLSVRGGEYPMRTGAGALVLVGVNLDIECRLWLVRYEAEDGSSFYEATPLPVPGDPIRFYKISDEEWDEIERLHPEDVS